MFNLIKVRNSNFEPYIPIRWDVKFSESSLNIISGEFPAKDVTFQDITPSEDKVEYAPGREVVFVSHIEKIGEVEITFYENNKRDIYNFLLKYYSKLENVTGSIVDSPLEMTLTINEYDNQLSVARTWIFKVQLLVNLNNILIQKAEPFEDKLRCLVIGIDK